MLYFIFVPFYVIGFDFLITRKVNHLSSFQVIRLETMGTKVTLPNTKSMKTSLISKFDTNLTFLVHKCSKGLVNALPQVFRSVGKDEAGASGSSGLM